MKTLIIISIIATASCTTSQYPYDINTVIFPVNENGTYDPNGKIPKPPKPMKHLPNKNNGLIPKC